MFVLQIPNTVSNVTGLWLQFRKYLFFEVQARITISNCKHQVAQQFSVANPYISNLSVLQYFTSPHGEKITILLPVRLTIVSTAWRVLSSQIEEQPPDMESTD
jgi:hypothetical protein